MKKPIFILSLVGILTVTVLLLSQKAVTITRTSNNQGAKLFGTYCMPCHGDLGKGDGQLAYLLYPKPRNFTKGMFKLQSTPSGEVPTDQDLAGTIRSGLPGTAMPSFYFLKENEIELLVAYVKQLSEECEKGKPCKSHFANQNPNSIRSPEPLPSSNELVAKGKGAFKQLGCDQCHGESGKGDGPSADGLKDGWGYPIRVRDFTQGTYLGGGQPKDLYLRFMAGMDGTPMPSFESSIQYLGHDEQERQQIIWGLIYYVKSLETDESRANKLPPPKDGIVHAQRTDDWRKEIDFLNLYSLDWQKSPSSFIPMSRLWQKDSNNASVVEVKAMYNEDFLAVMLQWRDFTMDAGSYRVQDFQDGAAVQFSLTNTPGFQGMGQPNNPCNIWFWRSEWQVRKEQGSKPNVKQSYPNRASDAETARYPSEIAEESRLSGRDAGNIVSREILPTAVEDINAKGPGTLTSQPLKEQDVQGRGEWDGKVWRVVFLRKLRNDEPNDVQFKTTKIYPVAFAVWNGSERDRNGQKMVSTWYSLKLQP